MFFTLLCWGFFIFSSIRPSPQIFSIIFLISLVVYWFFTRSFSYIPNQVKFIIYSFLSVFLTVIPNLFFNNGFSYDHFRSFNTPLSYVIGAITLMLMVGLRVYLKIKPVFYVICLSAYIGGIIAIIQKLIFGMDRIEGFSGIFEFANVNAVIGLCIFSYFFSEKSNMKEKIFFAIGFIFVILALIFSGSRGISIAFACGCISIFVFYLVYEYKRWVSLLKWFIILFFVGLMLMGIFPQVKESLLRYNEAKTDIEQYQKNYYDTSLGLRFKMWHEAWEAFKISPIIGLNPKSLCEYVKYKNTQEYSRNDCYQRLHSEFLNTLARKGILGLLALLSVWVSIAVLFFKQMRFCGFKRMLGISMFGVLILYIINGVGDEPMTSLMNGNFFILLVIIFISMLYGLDKDKDFVKILQ
ncbi:O-antigen ligase family protein [Helicobacter sp. 13S00477-4]|uniref:O-antigen ligase family protein n=1 Tax=Helicobacter sp. 13S00477-4 TaxID=1905759 RepID=UPI000BA69A34|nr:O-antigen ligase family protein [Helicobacter sp. 13S00477-4]PAF51548.1 hypothetical protein BKH44_05765 [Helicobacter sp. 13S00477-4]